MMILKPTRILNMAAFLSLVFGLLTNMGRVTNAAPSAIPPNLSADYPWANAAFASTLADVEDAFNAARTFENSDLSGASYTPMPMMDLTSTFTLAQWNALSDSDRALWLINDERTARDLLPLEGVEANITNVAQDYADLLFDTDSTGHCQPSGNCNVDSPFIRIDNDSVLGSCHEFLPYAENLAFFVSTFSIPFPVERAIYNWIYNDSSSSWGHRRAVLVDPYANNSGPSGSEGFMGIGRANGSGWSGFGSAWPNSEIIVHNFFDPCSTAQYGDFGDARTSYGDAWHSLSSLYLGDGRDGEIGAVPGGDNFDDGVTPTSGVIWVPGTVSEGKGGSVDVTVNGCSSTCYLNAWIDWDDDGGFGIGDQIFTDKSVGDGVSTLTFDIPTDASYGITLSSRFRLTNNSGTELASAMGDIGLASATPTGGATDGEVEDYSWSFSPTAVTLVSFEAGALWSRRPATMPKGIAVLAGIAGISVVLVKRRLSQLVYV